MSVRTSQAFAAFRQSLILELSSQVYDKLLPNWNAEIEDIRRHYETSVQAAEEAKTEVARAKLLELAESTKKSRILDLAHRKNEFINSLRTTLRMEIGQRIKEYKGEVFEEEEEKEGKKARKVEKVKFPDGSMAKVPQNLFIDFSDFQKA